MKNVGDFEWCAHVCAIWDQMAKLGNLFDIFVYSCWLKDEGFAVKFSPVWAKRRHGVFPQTGLPVRGSYSFERGACLGRVSWRLSPGLLACKRRAGCSECFGPHDFTLVSHMSPSSAPMSSGLSSTCLSVVSHLSRSIHSGCSEYVFWSECFRTCLPLVSVVSD